MTTVLVKAQFVRTRCVSMQMSEWKFPVRVQKVKVGSFSKPVEAGSKNLNTEVESIVLLGMKRRPAQIRKQPKSMLANSTTA